MEQLGQTAYVFVDNGSAGSTLINPVTGVEYSTTDTTCPLRSICCAFNGENVISVYLQQSNITQDMG